VHLHNHTQYSLLDGLTKVPELIKSIKSNGMKAVAMTDHGTLSGAIEFYKTAKAEGVKPIIGLEAYMAARKLTDKEPTKDKSYYHIILLASDKAGYQNLMALSTIANLEGFYYKPRIDRELLEKHNEGLICLSGCASSELGDALRQGQYDQAKEIAKWYKSAFGDRYYLEIQDHGHPDHPSRWESQTDINSQLAKLSEELNIKCVVTSDAHYLNPGDKEAHEILLCVQTGSFLSDEKRMSLKEFDLHVAKPSEIIERWGTDHPEYITNSREIADRCDLTIELGKILIPKFPVPKGESEKSYLDKLVYKGLAWRYGKDKGNKKLSEAAAQKLNVEEAIKTLPKAVADRASYEISVIDQMKFNGYFLIIQDFINWGKNKGIVFGPGRGSAAGSIISYGLKITELDPLAYDLLFERFLNPDRISMPDVDIDIQDSRREEVIQYCVNKYGKERVANIVTFGRMAARNAVRDVSRVLQVPYAEADRLAKMIPPPVQGRHIPLATSIKKDRDLKREYETNKTAERVFNLAVQMEGTIRSHGIHAAGVVIAPEDIVFYTPLEMAQKGVVATQYSMGPIEELGLLKMDFLGLSNLTIINNALRIIKRVYGKTIDINSVPLDDVDTYKLFQSGDTTGVFQFESAGMKRYLKVLKPTVFDDLIAMNALYRPGPMQWIDEFIARKLGLNKIEYLHPKTEPALETTYGVLVYQEQVMQIAKDLCGFSGGQADTLRKGVAKKRPEVLAALKKDFISGALNNSDITKTKINGFWNSLEAFAAYCFPKAHAACYATIAYQTAYLKAHYPAAFMAALMSSDYDDTDRLSIEIAECQHMGITVLAPDVNESFLEFSVVPDSGAIRFGMAAIKNVGNGAVEEILRARSEGEFAGLEDFLTRVSSRIVNRKGMESLIKTGAFDSFGDRMTLLHNMDLMLAYGGRVQKQAKDGQTDLFGSLDETIIERPKLEMRVPEVNPDSRERLAWERELLGLYLSQHPLEEFDTILSELAVPINSIRTEHDGKDANIGGAINYVREITTKKGQRMAFVGIEDRYGLIEAVIFPNSYEQSSTMLERDKVVLVRGKISARDKDGNPNGEIKIIVEKVREIDSERAKNYQPTGEKITLTAEPMKSKNEKVYIKLASTNDEKTLISLKEAIDAHSGPTEVVLVLGADKTRQAIRLPGGIDTKNGSLDSLQQLVGADNIVIQ
jgi:DNA polymerase-3 subunit alpha